MTLKLKTDRNCIIKWIIPWLIIGAVIYVFLMVDIYYNNNVGSASKGISIALAVVLLLLLSLILILKFVKRKLHIFTEETVRVYKGKKLIFDIKVEDIVSMKYTRNTVEYVYKWMTGDVARGGPSGKIRLYMKQKT